ncbi:MAG: hypothetical protein ACE5OZ_04405 [Candidatus Heimdallarchaeota archaeon]
MSDKIKQVNIRLRGERLKRFYAIKKKFLDELEDKSNEEIMRLLIDYYWEREIETL